MKTLAVILVKIAAAFLVVGIGGSTLAMFDTPCATEDSSGCYWDGDTRGNKTGASYLAVTETIVIRTND